MRKHTIDIYALRDPATCYALAFNSLDPGKYGCNFTAVIFTKGEWHKPGLRISSIGSDNGLVPSGSISLPEPMLTVKYIAIWRH